MDVRSGMLLEMEERKRARKLHAIPLVRVRCPAILFSGDWEARAAGLLFREPGGKGPPVARTRPCKISTSFDLENREQINSEIDLKIERRHELNE